MQCSVTGCPCELSYQYVICFWQIYHQQIWQQTIWNLEKGKVICKYYALQNSLFLSKTKSFAKMFKILLGTIPIINIHSGLGKPW